METIPLPMKRLWPSSWKRTFQATVGLAMEQGEYKLIPDLFPRMDRSSLKNGVHWRDISFRQLGRCSLKSLSQFKDGIKLQVAENQLIGPLCEIAQASLSLGHLPNA